MFSHPDLDSAPPQSQFRRPWSPKINVASPSGNNALAGYQQESYGRQTRQDSCSHETSPPRHARREASDVSVEALDLADYSRTLRARQAEDPYPPFPSQIRQNSNAQSSFPSLTPGASSTEFLPFLMPPVPFLISRGPTLSSNATHHTFSSVPRSAHRPFSLPSAPLSGSQASSSRARFNDGLGFPYSNPQITSSDGIDISHFPKWSRNWYNGNDSSANIGYPSPEVDADIYTPVPPSQLQSARTRKSIFDPGYVRDPHHPSNMYDFPQAPLSSVIRSSRDMLPWSNDLEYGPTVDPLMKEERMRMLEREFGENAKDSKRDFRNALVDEDGKPLLGTIDDKGRLVTAGPRRRVVLRILQVMLAAAACIPAIYAALVIKATDPKIPPPPASKPPAFVLYILSSMTLLILLYIFGIRPCCVVRSKPRSKRLLGNPANMGMMVLPVGQAGKKNKKPKPGKKGNGKWGPPGAQDVQVNLIVDPTAFQPFEASESESESDEENEDTMPGGYGPYDTRQQKERRKRRRRQRRRRGVFEGLAMEEQWCIARTWAKKVAMIDVAGLVLWSATFVFIMIGKRCPSGEFNGWCNAYNASTASACLLAVSFSVGIFFDVQDLHASKQSPRTRS